MRESVPDSHHFCSLSPIHSEKFGASILSCFKDGNHLQQVREERREKLLPLVLSTRFFLFVLSHSLLSFCVFPLMHFRDIHMSFRSRTFRCLSFPLLWFCFTCSFVSLTSLSFRTSPSLSLSRHCMVGESHKTCMRRDTRAMNVREREK